MPVAAAMSMSRPVSFAGRRGATRRVTCAKVVMKPVGDLNPDHIIRGGMSAPPPAVALEIAAGSSVVGRDEEGGADLLIPIPTVSCAHAKLEVEGDKVFVTDLKSTNGTFVDNERIAPDTKTELATGANVIFGDANLASYVVQVIPDAAAE